MRDRKSILLFIYLCILFLKWTFVSPRAAICLFLEQEIYMMILLKGEKRGEELFFLVCPLIIDYSNLMATHLTDWNMLEEWIRDGLWGHCTLFSRSERFFLAIRGAARYSSLNIYTLNCALSSWRPLERLPVLDIYIHLPLQFLFPFAFSFFFAYLCPFVVITFWLLFFLCVRQFWFIYKQSKWIVVWYIFLLFFFSLEER